MTRTFSKIHGLAALRLGWLYGPAHVVDALNRIRGPFNVSQPAIAAGVAAILDANHVEASAAHNARWLPWLTEEIGKLGLTVTPSAANFVLIHFPDKPGRSAKDADLVIVCVPVGQSGAVAAEIGPHLGEGTIVSDVGSVKAQVARDMAPQFPAGIHFVPAHPVAGTEYSGPDAGFAELFVDRWCILTPPENTDGAAVERLKPFWSALGANVETMSPDHHDLVLAVTSHLPHPLRSP